MTEESVDAVRPDTGENRGARPVRKVIHCDMDGAP
jgi:hypothetical protein